jgi:hypothetical protein
MRIGEIREAIRMVNYVRHDLTGHTREEFLRCDVPARFSKWLDAARGLQIPPRFGDDLEERERAVRHATDTIARWRAARSAATADYLARIGAKPEQMPDYMSGAVVAPVSDPAPAVAPAVMPATKEEPSVRTHTDAHGTTAIIETPRTVLHVAVSSHASAVESLRRTAEGMRADAARLMRRAQLIEAAAQVLSK